jgi:hypothetical protein
VSRISLRKSCASCAFVADEVAALLAPDTMIAATAMEAASTVAMVIRLS